MNIRKRLSEIEKEIDILSTKLDDKNRKFDFKNSDSIQDWEEYQEPENTKINKLSREKRMLITPEFSELPDCGDIMSLKDFIQNVKDGGFIDYDGFGNYVRDNMKSDIDIYPSDIRFGSIRDDFDTIVWFNR